jgi:hypothetical protein
MQVVASVESEGLWGVASERGLLRVGVCAAGPGGMKMQMQNAGCEKEEEMREMSRQIRGDACKCCGDGARRGRVRGVERQRRSKGPGRPTR